MLLAQTFLSRAKTHPRGLPASCAPKCFYSLSARGLHLRTLGWATTALCGALYLASVLPSSFL